jgi:hypothetical protein
MGEAETKPWWASKTILSDIATVLAAIAIAIYAYSVHHDAAEAATAFGVFTSLAGAGIVGRVKATQPIGSK